MKSSWKGSLSFGLVDINIELYSAVRSRALDFKLFHEPCMSPIEYHRWCDHCQKEVDWQEIEKGIRLKDGTFFVITPANLKKLKQVQSQAINIIEFIELGAIDPVLFNEHYYVVPTKEPYYSFFLFTQALRDLGKTAIGSFVLRDKEYICAIRPYKNILLLTTLNYAYEIKKLDVVDALKIPKAANRELALAKQLIKSMVKKTFVIEQYKDTFVVEFMKKISRLKKGRAISTTKKLEKPAKTSLMDALKKSLNQLKSTTVQDKQKK